MQRTIVITGVSRGLGKALVHEFVAMGHLVAGCARSEEAVERLRQEVGPAGSFHVVDVLDRSAVESWAEDVLQRVGPPDLLINNAGVMERDALFHDIPPEEFDRVIDVNVKSVANVIRAYLPAMRERKKGVIVSFSSGAGIRGYPEISAYCASKHAVEGLSRSLAKEVPEGMAVIPLQPGVIHTDLLDGHYGERAKEHDRPEVWVKRAAPYILNLGPEHNGESLRIPKQ